MTLAFDAPRIHLHDPRTARASSDAPKMAPGADKVDSKAESFRAKPRRDAREVVRPLLDEMVSHQEAVVGGRMEAYQVVGRWLGVEGTWVRRLLGRQKVGVSGDRLLAIVAAYRAHCARVEARAAATRAATARRWEEIDALVMGLGGPGPELGGEPAESGGAGPGAATRRDGRP